MSVLVLHHCIKSTSVTPLYIPCQKGHESCVFLLLQYKAEPNIASTDNVTPLNTTCQNGNESSVSLLLQHKADPNIADKK